MMEKFINMYKSMSIESKAGYWYIICNILQKIAPWLIMIVLTRIVTVSEFGVYSIYMSWLMIFEIIVTLRLYTNGYLVGLSQLKNEQHDIYTITLQILLFIFIFVWGIVLYFIYPTVDNMIGLDLIYFLFMFISFIGMSNWGIYSTRKRLNNEYVSIFRGTIYYNVLAPILGLTTMMFILKDSVLWFIGTKAIIENLFSLKFLRENIKVKITVFDKKLAIETIKYNLPLLPYYLSMVFLSQSDRIMIRYFYDDYSVAVYSISYSIGMIVFVVSGALNLSLQVWLFKFIKEKCYIQKCKSILNGTIFVGILCMLEGVFAPEAVMLLGGAKYLESTELITPIVISVLVMFIYQQYVNVLLYYKRTKLIMWGAMLSAVSNIFFNYILLPEYGYGVSAYTTLASYLILMIIYYYMMREECKKNNMSYNNVFCTYYQMLILVTISLIMFIFQYTYNNFMVRYIIAAGFIAILYICRNKLINMIRR